MADGPREPKPVGPDPQAVYAAVLSLVRFLDPGAADCRIVYRTAAGRRSLITIPPDGESETLPSLTDMERAVVQVVDEMRAGTVKGFDEIATASGFSNSERLREFVRHLAALGRLKKVHRGWEKV